MFERALIQSDAFQSGDRAAQVRDGFRDFCCRRIVIDRCGLCGVDRCLQCLEAFCRVAAIEVTVSGLCAALRLYRMKNISGKKSV